VQSVVEGSPAERAGVRGGELPALIGGTRLVLGGDVILAIEEQKACHRECILHELRTRAEAASITLTLWREGREIQMQIPVERPQILGRSAPSGE
ncbi:MAG: PDZ domain-containing protein, partial [Acidobacteria bacterium]|nr:PDZ domain-containing protein [Acidobacteriota bacterium]